MRVPTKDFLHVGTCYLLWGILFHVRHGTKLHALVQARSRCLVWTATNLNSPVLSVLVPKHWLGMLEVQIVGEIVLPAKSKETILAIMQSLLLPRSVVRRTTRRLSVCWHAQSEKKVGSSPRECCAAGWTGPIHGRTSPGHPGSSHGRPSCS